MTINILLDSHVGEMDDQRFKNTLYVEPLTRYLVDNILWKEHNSRKISIDQNGYYN